MKFIELTYLDGKKFVFPLQEFLVFEQEDDWVTVSVRGADVQVQESLEEIQQKICRLGGDVQ